MEKFIDFIASPTFITSAALCVITPVVLAIFRRYFNRFNRSERGKGERASVVRLSFYILRIVIIFAVITFVLKINGINVVSLIAGLGIVSAIIGLAMQDFIKDIIMGLYVVLYHFYSVGELVEYHGREAEVMGFNLKTTKIGDMEDHSIITICNRNITEIRRIAGRLDIDVPLSYKEDPQTVRTVLHMVCNRIQESIEGVTKCDYLGTQSFESSSILYRIRLFCEPKHRPEARRAALGIILDALNAVGIAIPFNQMDVHLDTASDVKTASISITDIRA